MKIKLNTNPFKLNLINSQTRSTDTTCASQFKFKIVVYNYNYIIISFALIRECGIHTRLG